MPQLPSLSDVVILGLAAWAIAVVLRFSGVGAPVRALGAWARRQRAVVRWPFIPAMAALECLFCVSWWTAGAMVTLARPDPVLAIILIPAVVGVATLADSLCTALSGRGDPKETPESALQGMLNAQRVVMPPPPPPPRQ